MLVLVKKTQGRDTRRGQSLRNWRGDPSLEDRLTFAQVSELESPGRGDVGANGAAGDHFIKNLLNLRPIRFLFGAHIELNKDPAIQLPKEKEVYDLHTPAMFLP